MLEIFNNNNMQLELPKKGNKKANSGRILVEVFSF